MKMYDFTQLALDQMGVKEDVGNASFDSSYIDAKMDAVCEMLSKEIFEGFWNAGVHKMSVGSHRLSLQKFRTQGINDYLFHYGDSEKKFSVTFYMSLFHNETGSGIKHDGKFHVMRVDANGGIPYPFGDGKPSQKDMVLLAGVVADLAKNIEEVMDSPFKKGAQQ